MKSVLISIRPEYVEKILNGEKTIEIRKTMPKCELPCKVYIYCTKPRQWLMDSPFSAFSPEQLWWQDGKLYNGKENSLWNPKFKNPCFLNGKVIAEFTLNVVEDFECASYDFRYLVENTKCCLTMDEVLDYSKGQDLYGWYIDHLKIYDKPKELSQFRKQNKCHYANYEDGCCFECCTFYDLGDCDGKYSKLEKPPQSWCYVEKAVEDE